MRVRNIRTALTVITISLVALAGVSCNGKSSSDISARSVSRMEKPPSPAIEIVRIDHPADNSSFYSNDMIEVRLSLTGDDLPDSTRVYFDGLLLTTLLGGSLTFELNTAESRLGRIPVKIMAYSNGRRPQVLTHFINLYSDITPVLSGYKVVNSYPHDKGAYTQGLVYHDGYFIESTGQEGRSSLRRVEIVTGEVLFKHDLETKFFGEGIVLYKGRIFQLTWTTRVGFVYDAESFTLISRIHYDTQGWGLTTDGEQLIMSDGTNKLYFLEPDYFTVLSSVEVYDNREAVWQLNELEYIDGEIWANIYMTDRIARIDPASGKVLGYIDLTGLLSENEKPEENDEVLNGIAWDEQGSRLFVTGKHWPRVFQIEVSRQPGWQK